MKLYNKKIKGFTLIELLVVVAIISLLSSIVFSSLNGARSKARDAQRKSDLVQMRNALELWYANNPGSDYLISDGNINDGEIIDVALVESSPPYLARLPLDPKGSSYTQYAYHRKDFRNTLSYPCFDSSGGTKRQYAFYARLENPSPSDPNFISGTVGDEFDKCLVPIILVNYKISN